MLKGAHGAQIGALRPEGPRFVEVLLQLFGRGGRANR